MIDAAQIRGQITRALPDAQISIEDLTGTSNHYRVRVVSSAFVGRSPLERHRMVYGALRRVLESGELHALSLDTDTPHPLSAENAVDES